MEQHFRDKLKGKQIAWDKEGSWIEVEKRLHKKKRRGIMFWLLLGSVVGMGSLYATYDLFNRRQAIEEVVQKVEATDFSENRDKSEKTKALNSDKSTLRPTEKELQKSVIENNDVKVVSTVDEKSKINQNTYANNVELEEKNNNTSHISDTKRELDDRAMETFLKPNINNEESINETILNESDHLERIDGVVSRIQFMYPQLVATELKIEKPVTLLNTTPIVGEKYNWQFELYSSVYTHTQSFKAKTNDFRVYRNQI